MEYVIKKATKNDIKDLNHFLTLLIRDEKNYDNNINEECVINDMYDNLIEMDNNCLLVVKDNEQKNCGYLFGFICDKGDAYINKTAQLDAMYILEEHRKNGLGTVLISEFIKWAQEKEVKSIQVGVCEKNNKAIDLYEKFGFKNIKLIKELYIED